MSTTAPDTPLTSGGGMFGAEGVRMPGQAPTADPQPAAPQQRPAQSAPAQQRPAAAPAGQPASSRGAQPPPAATQVAQPARQQPAAPRQGEVGSRPPAAAAAQQGQAPRPAAQQPQHQPGARPAAPAGQPPARPAGSGGAPAGGSLAGAFAPAAMTATGGGGSQSPDGPTKRETLGHIAYTDPRFRKLMEGERFFQLVQQLAGALGNNPILSARLNNEGLAITTDEEQDAVQRRFVGDLVARTLPELRLGQQGITKEELVVIVQRVYDEIVGLGPMGPAWRDPEVTEIMVNGPEQIFVERSGKMLSTDLRFRDLNDAQTVARNLAERQASRTLSPAQPVVGAEMPGARVQFVTSSAVVKDGISITIRKFRKLFGMAKLLEFGSLTEEMRDFLADCVEARATVLVSGGTGTGKTTIINALSEYIPSHERVVTIEDAFELQLAHTNLVRLQTKEKASADDTVQLDMGALMKSSLRMRPDRVIVGEIRDAAAATTMMDAANTGHDGTLTTVHASSATAAFNVRMPRLVAAGANVNLDLAKLDIVGAVDLVLQITRDKSRRFMSEIATVDESCIQGSHVVPNSLWTGRMGPEGKPVFTRGGRLAPDSRLALKMLEAGVDPSRWCT